MCPSSCSANQRETGFYSTINNALGCHCAGVQLSNMDFVIPPLFWLKNALQVLMPADNYTVLTHQVSASVNMSHTQPGRLHKSSLYIPSASVLTWCSENVFKFIIQVMALLKSLRTKPQILSVPHGPGRLAFLAVSDSYSLPLSWPLISFRFLLKYQFFNKPFSDYLVKLSQHPILPYPTFPFTMHQALF